MPRVSSNESMKSKIAKAEAKVSRLKDGYENALRELGDLRKKQGSSRSQSFWMPWTKVERLLRKSFV